MRPLFTRLVGIVGELAGDRADPQHVRLCAQSVVGQCIFLPHAQECLRRLGPDAISGRERIEAIADHIAAFLPRRDPRRQTRGKEGAGDELSSRCACSSATAPSTSAIIVGVTFASLLITQQLAIFTGLMTRTFGAISDLSQPAIWGDGPEGPVRRRHQAAPEHPALPRARRRRRRVGRPALQGTPQGAPLERLVPDGQPVRPRRRDADRRSAGDGPRAASRTCGAARASSFDDVGASGKLARPSAIPGGRPEPLRVGDHARAERPPRHRRRHLPRPAHVPVAAGRLHDVLARDAVRPARAQAPLPSSSSAASRARMRARCAIASGAPPGSPR